MLVPRRSSRSVMWEGLVKKVEVRSCSTKSLAITEL
jgi:hypothetical protein